MIATAVQVASIDDPALAQSLLDRPRRIDIGANTVDGEVASDQLVEVVSAEGRGPLRGDHGSPRQIDDGYAHPGAAQIAQHCGPVCGNGSGETKVAELSYGIGHQLGRTHIFTRIELVARAVGDRRMLDVHIECGRNCMKS